LQRKGRGGKGGRGGGGGGRRKFIGEKFSMLAVPYWCVSVLYYYDTYSTYEFGDFRQAAWLPSVPTVVGCFVTRLTALILYAL